MPFRPFMLYNKPCDFVIPAAKKFPRLEESAGRKSALIVEQTFTAASIAVSMMKMPRIIAESHRPSGSVIERKIIFATTLIFEIRVR